LSWTTNRWPYNCYNRWKGIHNNLTDGRDELSLPDMTHLVWRFNYNIMHLSSKVNLQPHFCTRSQEKPEVINPIQEDAHIAEESDSSQLWCMMMSANWMDHTEGCDMPSAEATILSRSCQVSTVGWVSKANQRCWLVCFCLICCLTTFVTMASSASLYTPVTLWEKIWWLGYLARCAVRRHDKHLDVNS
jgi:hypothetical protein